jgi:hypothetical protein
MSLALAKKDLIPVALGHEIDPNLSDIGLNQT